MASLASLAAPELRQVNPSPFLKWAGGKSRLLNELVSRAPRDYVRYFEPFLGGGALFFRLQPRAAVLSDINAEMVACYSAVKRHPEKVIRALERHESQHDEAYYYTMRHGWNHSRAGLDLIERAAAFIYFNKTCYNGLWRVNASGEFNVPIGRYVRPAIVNAEALRAASQALGKAKLRNAPFEQVLDEAEAGDFVYFDPPYHPVSATACFTSYTAQRFDMFDQERLAEIFRELDQRGCAVMLSNSDTPFIRRLYAGYRVHRVYCNRAINSKAAERAAVPEVIVTNRY